MRTLDAPFPFTVAPVHPTAGPVARRLRIAVERLPAAPYVWDDDDPTALWDDADPDRFVWDAPFIGSGFTDAVCDFMALTLEAGNPDENGLLQSARAELTLDNRAGTWSLYDATGRLTYYAPGRRLQVYALADPAAPEASGCWLFAGRVGSWDENADGTVTVTAWDGFALLAQAVGADWTPGAATDTTGVRLGKIATARTYPDATAFASSSTVLAAPVSQRSPLEEMEVTSLSDGGVLFVDQDGRLTWMDRSWTTGRTDQPTVPVFTDNLCEAAVSQVWDLTLATNDDQLASTVRLTNTVPVTVAATDPAPELGVSYTYSHPEPDLWSVTADGQQLANVLLTRLSNRATAMAFALYPLDPRQDLWSTVLDRRLLDRVRFVREVMATDGPSVMDVDLIVTTLRHEVTPDTWVANVATTRAIAYRRPQLWDASQYAWDDAATENVWSY